MLDVHPQLLRALVAVLDAGSLTAASERLGYTQSALSKQMATLEAAAGTPLVVRGPRGVEPTEAGHRLARRAVAVLDQLDAAQRELSDLEAPVSGRVALGAFPTASMHLVPRALAQLRRDYPEIEVDFQELSTPVGVRRLRAGRVDLAILATGSGIEWDDTGIDVRRLPSGPLLLAMSEHHPLARERRVPVAALAGERWIAARGSRGDPQFGVWPTLDAPTVAVELADWSSRLGFVATDLGVTSIPALAAHGLPAGIVTVEVDDPNWQGREMVLGHVGPPTTAATALREALLDAAREIAGRAAGG